MKIKAEVFLLLLLFTFILLLKVKLVSLTGYEGNLCLQNSILACNCPLPEEGIGSFGTGGGYVHSTGNPGMAISKETMTFSAWINVDRGLSGTLMIGAIIHNNGGQGYLKLSLVSGSSELNCQTHLVSTFTHDFSFINSDLTDNLKWNFVACSYNRGIMQIYCNDQNAEDIQDFDDSVNTPNFEAINIGADDGGSNVFSGRIVEINLFQDYFNQELINQLMFTLSDDVLTQFSSYNPLYVISGKVDSLDITQTYKAPGLNDVEIIGTLTILMSYQNGYPICDGNGMDKYKLTPTLIADNLKAWHSFNPPFSDALIHCPTSITELGFVFSDPECIADLQHLCCDELLDSYQDVCIQAIQLGLISQCQSLDTYSDEIIEECFSKTSSDECLSSMNSCDWIDGCKHTYQLSHGITEAQLLYNSECSAGTGDSVTCPTLTTSSGVSCSNYYLCQPNLCSDYTTQATCDADTTLGCIWVDDLNILNSNSDAQCRSLPCNGYSTQAECDAVTHCSWSGYCKRTDELCYLYDSATCTTHSSYCSEAQYCLADCEDIGNDSSLCFETDGCKYIGCTPSSSVCSSLSSWDQCEKVGFIECYFSDTSCEILSSVQYQKPQLISAYYEKRGMALRISFSRPTNFGEKTQTLSCSTLFQSASLAKFGDSSQYRCVFEDPKTLVVHFGDGATLEEELIYLNSDVIADEDYTSFLHSASELQITAEYPSPRPSPKAIIRLPGTAVTCQNLIIDGSTSIGLGGRPLQYQWIFDSPLASYSTSMSSSFPQREINKADLSTSVSQYTLTLTVRNFIGEEHSSSASFNAKNKNVPNLISSQGTEISLDNSKDNYIEIEISIASCLSSPLNKKDIEVNWSFLTSETISLSFTTLYQQLIIPQGSTNPLEFLVKAYDSTEYNLDSTAYSDLIINVTPYYPQLKCIIIGGNTQMGVYDERTLYGSSSYDPSGLGLTYIWSSKELSDDTEITYSISGVDGATTADVTIAPGDLQSDKAYRIYLTISQATASRSSVCSTVIYSTGTSFPYLSIYPDSQIYKLNPYSYNEITAGIIPFLDTMAISEGFNSIQWEFQKGEDFKDIDFKISPSQDSILISPNYLKEGSSYTIAVIAEDETGIQVTSSIEFETNIAPNGGSFTVTPSLGTSYSTEFSLTAKNWIDDDLPLKYEFFYIGTTSKEIPLTPLSTKSTYKIMLPPGSPSLVIVCYIFDSLNAYVRRSVTITVNEFSEATYSNNILPDLMTEYSEPTHLITEILMLAEVYISERSIDYSVGVTYDEEYLTQARLIADTSITKIQDLITISNSNCETASYLSGGLYRVSVDPLALSDTNRVDMVSILTTLVGMCNSNSFLEDWFIENVMNIFSSILGAMIIDPLTPNSLQQKITISSEIQTIIQTLSDLVLSTRPKNYPLKISTPLIYTWFQRLQATDLNDKKFDVSLSKEDSSDPTLSDYIQFPSNTYDYTSTNMKMIYDISLAFYKSNPVFINHINSTQDIATNVLSAVIYYKGDSSQYSGQTIVGASTLVDFVSADILNEGIEIYLSKNKSNWVKDEEAQHKCLYFDTTSYEWSEEGCISYNTDQYQLQCLCNHLSIFGGNFSPPIIVFPRDEEFELINEFIFRQYNATLFVPKEASGLLVSGGLLLIYLILGSLLIEKEKRDLAVQKKLFIINEDIDLKAPNTQISPRLNPRSIAPPDTKSNLFLLQNTPPINKNKFDSQYPKPPTRDREIKKEIQPHQARMREHNNNTPSFFQREISYPSSPNKESKIANSLFPSSYFMTPTSPTVIDELVIPTSRKTPGEDSAAVKNSVLQDAWLTHLQKTDSQAYNYINSQRNFIQNEKPQTKAVSEFSSPQTRKRNKSHQLLHKRPNFYILILEEHKTIGIYYKTDEQYSRLAKLTVLFLTIYSEILSSAIMTTITLNNWETMFGIICSLILTFILSILIQQLFKKEFIFSSHSKKERNKIQKRNRTFMFLGILISGAFASATLFYLFYFGLEYERLLWRWSGVCCTILSFELFLIEEIEVLIKVSILYKWWARTHWTKWGLNLFKLFYSGRIILETITGEKIFV